MRGPGSGTFANPVPPLQGSAATCLAPRVPDPAIAGSSTLGFSVSPLRGLPDPPLSCWLLRPLSRVTPGLLKPAISRVLLSIRPLLPLPER